MTNITSLTSIRAEKPGKRGTRDIQETLAKLYKLASDAEAVYNEQISRSFLTMWTDQYGADKAAGAATWWASVTQLGQQRTDIMQQWRDFLRNKTTRGEITNPRLADFINNLDTTKSRTGGLWLPFLREVYLPLIGESLQAGMDGAYRMHQDLTGEVPTAERPTVDAVQSFENELRRLRGEGGQPQPPAPGEPPPAGPEGTPPPAAPPAAGEPRPITVEDIRDAIVIASRYIAGRCDRRRD